MKVIAWIILILGILGAIVAALAGTTLFNNLGSILPQAQYVSQIGGLAGGIVVGILTVIISLVYFLIFYVVGESLHLQLAVEENTRLTAALLLRMHQEGQGESTSPYGAGGGFAHEPYDN